jgi:predicted enzyme related to lactoylglutathione lyase
MTTDPRENRIDYVEFPAPDPKALAASKAFYKQVFGWTYQDWGSEYSDTKDSGLGSGVTCTGAAGRVTLAVLYVSDLEGARARVQKAGGRIEQDIFSFPGGRRFEYTDPAGNRLGVWSDK